MKFSVEPTLTVGQLMLLIRRRLDVEPEIGLFVYSLDRDTKAQRCPSTSNEVSSLHADSEDGFIYGSVHAEVALGGGGSGFSILVCCTLTPIAITAIVLLLVGSFISPDSSGTLCTGLVNGSCSAFYSVCDSDQVEVVPRPEFGQRLCPIPMRCCAPVAISAAAAVPLLEGKNCLWTAIANLSMSFIPSLSTMSETLSGVGNGVFEECCPALGGVVHLPSTSILVAQVTAGGMISLLSNFLATIPAFDGLVISIAALLIVTWRRLWRKGRSSTASAMKDGSDELAAHLEVAEPPRITCRDDNASLNDDTAKVDDADNGEDPDDVDVDVNHQWTMVQMEEVKAQLLASHHVRRSRPFGERCFSVTSVLCCKTVATCIVTVILALKTVAEHANSSGASLWESYNAFVLICVNGGMAKSIADVSALFAMRLLADDETEHWLGVDALMTPFVMFLGISRSNVEKISMLICLVCLAPSLLSHVIPGTVVYLPLLLLLLAPYLLCTVAAGPLIVLMCEWIADVVKYERGARWRQATSFILRLLAMLAGSLFALMWWSLSTNMMALAYRNPGYYLHRSGYADAALTVIAQRSTSCYFIEFVHSAERAGLAALALI